MAPPTASIVNFKTLERKFRRGCGHIRVLNRKIEDVQTRYDRAYDKQNRSFRYTYRLQLASMEGVRNMCYEWASQRADELESLQDVLIDQGLISPAREGEH